jgi:hypothetical protein
MASGGCKITSPGSIRWDILAKNLGLAAGAVGIYFIYQSFPDAPFSLAGPLL